MKLSDRLIMTAIVCFAAVSCTNKKPDDIKPDDPLVFRNASARYYGATENSDAYFAMDLTDGDKKLHLEFYGDPVGDYDAPELKTGNYSLATDSSAEAGTFIPGSEEGGSVYSETTGTSINLYNIVEGTFSISLSETNYKVAVGLKNQDGDEVLGSYTGPITVEDTRDLASDFAYGFVSFYGKDIADDAHLFWVGLSSDGLTWDPASKGYVGNGYYVRLSVITGTDALTEIPDGTYTVANSISPGSILTDDYTHYGEVADDVTTLKLITSGTVTFRKAGDVYSVIMDLTDSDGNNYSKFYRGELDYANYSTGLIENLDMGAFASGQMTYNGKTDMNAYNFSLILLGNGTEIEPGGSIAGTGYVMFLDMYTEMTTKTDIEPATYGVADTGAPGTVHGAYVYIFDKGSYIYWIEDGFVENTIHIKDGTITVSGANPGYNLQMAFIGPNGFNINGSYNGSLEYFDESTDSVQLPETSPSNRYRFPTMVIGNWGSYYGEGTTNLVYSFITDEVNMFLDAIVPDIGNSTIAPAGTYTFADTNLVNTLTGYSNVYSDDFMFDVEGGAMTITDLNDAGDRIYTFDFDIGEKGMFYAEHQPTTPRDIEVTEFDSGSVEFYGSQYSGGTSNNFYVILYGKGTSLVNGSYYGTGSIITLDIYTDLSATTEIPDGVYNVTDSRSPGSILKSSYATRYFEIINGTADISKPFVSGSATVSKSGNTYTIDMAFADAEDENITGLFTGELEYIDKALAPAPRNYVEMPSTRIPARREVPGRPDMTKPTAGTSAPVNRLSKDAVKKNAAGYEKSAESMRLPQGD